MQNIIRQAGALIVVLMIAACASGPIRVDEMSDRNVGMIYGQLKMPNENWNIVKLVLIQRVGKVYWGMGLQGLGEKIHVTPDGRYVAENLLPGKYMLGGLVIGSETSLLGKSALNYTVEVKAGEIHYLGTYNYVPKARSNFMMNGTFELVNDQSKNAHARLLAWLEETTRETRWHSIVKKRLVDKQLSIPAKN